MTLLEHCLKEPRIMLKKRKIIMHMIPLLSKNRCSPRHQDRHKLRSLDYQTQRKMMLLANKYSPDLITVSNSKRDRRKTLKKSKIVNALKYLRN